MPAITDATELRSRLNEIMYLYDGAQQLCPKIPQLRFNIPSSAQNSLQRFSSRLFPCLSGLSSADQPTSQDHLDAVIKTWSKRGAEYVRTTDPRHKEIIRSIDTFSEAIRTLATDLKTLRDSIDLENSRVASRPPAPQKVTPERVQQTSPARRPPNRVTQTFVSPEEVQSRLAERAVTPRATGPSKSGTGLPTYVEGLYLRTNARGELEVRLENAFDEITSAISAMADAASTAADQWRKEKGYSAYMDILSRNDNGMEIGPLPSRDDFMDAVEKVRLKGFSDEAVAQILLDTRNRIAAESLKKLNHALTRTEVTDITMDLVVHTHWAYTRRRNHGDVTDGLVYFVHQALQADETLRTSLDENALRRVCTQYPKHAHSNPKVSFTGFGR